VLFPDPTLVNPSVACTFTALASLCPAVGALCTSDDQSEVFFDVHSRDLNSTIKTEKSWLPLSPTSLGKAIDIAGLRQSEFLECMFRTPFAIRMNHPPVSSLDDVLSFRDELVANLAATRELCRIGH